MIEWTTPTTYMAIVLMAIVLGVVFIPGPATIPTVPRATRSGVRVGLATGVALALGANGLGRFMRRHPAS